MESVHVELGRGRGVPWSQVTAGQGQAWARGFSFCDGDLLAGRAFAESAAGLLGESQNQPEDRDLGRAIRNHNGCFALVVETKSLLVAVVDRVRSLPLFYGQREGEMYLSDDADWVRQKLSDDRMDDTAVTEFLLTGFVTGPETLFPNVKQLQAGEYLMVSAPTGPIRARTHRYYQWIHGDYFTGPAAELNERLDQVLLGVFERLLGSTKGRTIVLPLSGGWGSRSIAAMLRRLGRKDVVCFSYGVPGNWESEVSRRVAETLGYPWEFLPSSPSRWREWLATSEREECCQYASGLSSTSILSSCLALRELKRTGKIPDDAVFVPGHSEVPSGAHAPWGLAGMPEVSQSAVVSEILRSHYNLWDWGRKRDALLPVLSERVKRSLCGHPLSSREDAVGAVECWVLQERQAKFIVNACRMYEFWGFDWRLPLCDKALLDFWGQVPVDLRLGRRLFRACLDEGVFAALGIRQERFADLLRPYSAFAETKWRVLPFTSPFYGLGSYSQLLAAYQTYRRYFGNSLPPLCAKIDDTYESALTLTRLRGHDGTDSRSGGLASLLRAVEIGSLVVRGGMRKAAHFCSRHVRRGMSSSLR